MTTYYIALVAVAVLILIAAAILLRKRYRNFRHRRKLSQMRNKADRLIAGSATIPKEKITTLIDKFFKFYETSVYVQEEDRSRIQELSQIRNGQRDKSGERSLQ